MTEYVRANKYSYDSVVIIPMTSDAIQKKRGVCRTYYEIDESKCIVMRPSLHQDNKDSQNDRK